MLCCHGAGSKGPEEESSAGSSKLLFPKDCRGRNLKGETLKGLKCLSCRCLVSAAEASGLRWGPRRPMQCTCSQVPRNRTCHSWQAAGVAAWSWPMLSTEDKPQPCILLMAWDPDPDTSPEGKCQLLFPRTEQRAAASLSASPWALFLPQPEGG